MSTARTAQVVDVMADSTMLAATSPACRSAKEGAFPSPDPRRRSAAPQRRYSRERPDQLLGPAPHDRARDQHASRIRGPVPGLLSILRPAPAARAGVESSLCPLPSADHRKADRRTGGVTDRGRGPSVRGRAATRCRLRTADAGARTWLRLAAAAGAPAKRRRGSRRQANRGRSRSPPDALPDHRRPCVQSRETGPRLGDGVAPAT